MGEIHMSLSAASGAPQPTSPTLYGAAPTGRRVTTRDLIAAKARGEKWPMITAYDALTARIFDEAGIPVMLVGDSAAMVVYGYDSTVPVTVDDLLPLAAAVVRGSIARPGGRRPPVRLLPGLARSRRWRPPPGS